MQPKFLTLVVSLAFGGSALLAPTALADSASCAPAPEAGRVIVTVDVDGTSNQPPVLLQREGQIAVADSDDLGSDCGSATSIDTISIRSADPPGHPAFIFLDTSRPLGPGATDEPGTSDEIEIDVDFVRGGYLGFRSFSGPLRITLGGRGVNLNRDEETGVDADVTLRGIEGLAAETTMGPDVIDGSGGEGTGPRAGAFRISAVAPVLDRARDVLVGTSRMDRLHGGGGSDVIRGGAMRDRLYGGRGADRLMGGPGSDSLLGGDGRDRCTVGPLDGFAACEIVRPAGSGR